MILSGKQKAAVLLASLDAVTAAELLKGVEADMVQELAVELASLDASGLCDPEEQVRVAKEFCTSLVKRPSQGLNIGRFLNEMLVNLLGKEKAEQIRFQLKKATEHKDVFTDIASAGADELVAAMEGEHPQVIATVLSSLAPRKSQEVLSLLNEETRRKTVWKMTTTDLLGFGVKQRIAATIGEKLKSFKGGAVAATHGRQEENLRKLAIVLSGLDKALRDQLLDEIGKQDEEVGKIVKHLMVTWEDIPSITDRSLQTALRGIDPRKLALALVKADEKIAKKIRSNISERAVAAIDEETSLMTAPKKVNIEQAREEVVKILREMNEKGELDFIEEEE